MNVYTENRRNMRIFTFKILFKTVIGCAIAVLFVLIAKMCLFDRAAVLWEKPSAFPVLDLREINVTTGAILRVRNSTALLVSAYLDKRFSSRTVRIIAIVKRSQVPQFYCQFYNSSWLVTARAKVLIHPEHFSFPYGTAFIMCQMPNMAEVASYITVTTTMSPKPAGPLLRIRPVNRGRSLTYPRQFSVCISTLFGNYSNVLQFVQSLEMYRILGAQKVFIYKSDCSPVLQRVLDYYVAEGFIEVIAWDIQHYLNVSRSWLPSLDPGDLHYYGQITTLNDCVYRNMPESRYVVLNDIDEVVVPILHRDWVEMMDTLSSAHLGVESFFVENSVFRTSVTGDTGEFNLWGQVPGVNILQHVHREPYRRFTFSACKMIVNPRAVVWTSVHRVPWRVGASMWVPSSVARLHHCRKDDDMKVREKDLIRDTTIWKYSSSLIRNVNRVLKEAF